MLFPTGDLNITLDNLLDAPKAGDPQYQMTETHGADMVPWQEVWVRGASTLLGPRARPTNHPLSTTGVHT